METWSYGGKPRRGPADALPQDEGLQSGKRLIGPVACHLACVFPSNQAEAENVAFLSHFSPAPRPLPAGALFSFSSHGLLLTPFFCDFFLNHRNARRQNAFLSCQYTGIKRKYFWGIFVPKKRGVGLFWDILILFSPVLSEKSLPKRRARSFFPVVTFSNLTF